MINTTISSRIRSPKTNRVKKKLTSLGCKFGWQELTMDSTNR